LVLKIFESKVKLFVLCDVIPCMLMRRFNVLDKLVAWYTRKNPRTSETLVNVYKFTEYNPRRKTFLSPLVNSSPKQEYIIVY
jgi:hypothetical protein